MRADESYIYKLYSEFDHNDQTIVVPFDVEYIVLVPYIVHAVESLLYVGEAGSFTAFYNTCPFLQGHP